MEQTTKIATSKSNLPSKVRAHEQLYNITDPLPRMTIYDYVYQNNLMYEGNPAFDYMGTVITYSKFFKMCQKTVQALAHYGVKKGDIVTIMMPTQPETFYLFYALSRLGAVANMVDPRYPKDYLEHAINRVESELVIASTATGDSLKNAKQKTSAKEIIMAAPGLSVGLKAILTDKELRENAKNMTTTDFAKSCNSWRRFLKDGKQTKDIDFPEYEPDLTVAMVGTGGTTGTPKLVELTNDNINSAVFQCMNANFNFQREHTWYDIMPPFIAFGIVDGLHLPLSKGMKVILEPQPSPARMIKVLTNNIVNHQACGPNFYTETKDDPRLKNADLTQLYSPILGGKNINPKNEIEVNQALKKQGCPSRLRVGYGLTECAGAASAPGTDDTALPQSCGATLPEEIVSTFRPIQNEDGTISYQELPYIDVNYDGPITENMSGELWISGPNVMKGYYKNEEETNRVLIKHDGRVWLRTGDLGYVTSNGLVYVIGRSKELIIRFTGFKVPPKEIEDIILADPAVDDCKVVGFENPHITNDQLPKVYYTLTKDIKNPNIKEIESRLALLCEAKLPDYKWPVAFECLEKMPLTPIAKIDIKKLQADATEKAQTVSKQLCLRIK